ncbi:MAG: methylaspartate mutase sigma subunit [Kiritimatiellia bacterium]|jgi:methylaspartate mutase sigma subunit
MIMLPTQINNKVNAMQSITSKTEKFSNPVARRAENTTVVIGVIGADCHAVGNKIIANVLGRLGFTVVNLGVMVSQDEYIDAALEYEAQAILVSSIYGHGETDCKGMRSRCEQRGIGDMILYVGGNLVIGKKDFSAVKSLFLTMGYDRVFSPSDDLQDVAAYLEMDVENNKLAEKQRVTA